MNYCCSLLLLFFVYTIPVKSQPQDSINRKKLNQLILLESSLYGVGMTGLGFLWYQGQDRHSFRFFNDNKQWLQMDKIGHAFTAYQLSRANIKLLKNAGLPEGKAMLYSSIAATAMMLPIEIFDGFSPTYGASWGDALANTIGAFLPYHQLLFDANYMHPKFSFSPSPYAHLRPHILGNNLLEQSLKDYNGQTYWLSTNFNIFSQQNVFPDWLAFSIGYSGNQMVYGSPSDNTENGYRANRQWFLSLDMDFSKFETDSKWLNGIFYFLNMVKIPFPSLEWTGKQVLLHPIYF